MFIYTIFKVRALHSMWLSVLSWQQLKMSELDKAEDLGLPKLKPAARLLCCCAWKEWEQCLFGLLISSFRIKAFSSLKKKNKKASARRMAWNTQPINWMLLLSFCYGSLCCIRKMGKGIAGFTGWVGRLFKPLYSSLFFPHFRSFLLVAHGWDLRKDVLLMGLKCGSSFGFFVV